MSREIFFGYVPVGTIVVFAQPVGNLLGSLLVVDFGDDDWTLRRKKLDPPAQHFVLTTLHVDLHQLWRRFTG